MFNWEEEWNISFAGCGFRSVYHLGALSCVLERLPRLVHGASKICGASSGCLVAAALTVGIPIEEFTADVLTVAKEARRHTLGVFHPTFSLQRTVRSLLEKLPADAHLRASGRLCVSLTRLPDRRNVLVSQFESREDLIQALMCSCFFPVYCGFIPPSFHGVRYIDGALSNNMPLFERRNTVTIAPFSGESDICPREGTFNFFEVHYGNVSIQVNTGNVHRICTSFLPPRPETLAEICHNGYRDALLFLRERGELGAEGVPPGLSQETLLDGQNPQRGDRRRLKVAANLPPCIAEVLWEACRDGHHGDTRVGSQVTDFLPVRLLMSLLSLLLLPVEVIFSLAKRAFGEQRCCSSSSTSDLTGAEQTEPASSVDTSRGPDSSSSSPGARAAGAEASRRRKREGRQPETTAG
ncbi:patatin-like phospholipase domain-containing protein 2 [Pungitius pungitius]|uniref:patatin-like phospholipase domain-containing protein 2 n=1 Tax=Pungitius pungitius TaxID=134920 RepID=UPI002E121499